MRNTARAFWIGLSLLAAMGCVEEGLFTECPFDETIEANCVSSETGVALTCIVKEHPQCPEDICLRWESAAQATCTQSCKAATDCPNGSQCTPFQDNASTAGETTTDCALQTCYCVQDADLGL
jgi:hypothetical protein